MLSRLKSKDKVLEKIITFASKRLPIPENNLNTPNSAKHLKTYADYKQAANLMDNCLDDAIMNARLNNISHYLFFSDTKDTVICIAVKQYTNMKAEILEIKGYDNRLASEREFNICYDMIKSANPDVGLSMNDDIFLDDFVL